MKYFLFFFLLLSPFLNAADSLESDGFYQQYSQSSKRTITGIIDDLSKNMFYILLDDGTAWECFYSSQTKRQKVLRSWKIGAEVFIATRTFENPDACGISTFNSFVELDAYIDLSTADLLPKVVNILNGVVTLSDGSAWKENSFLYNSSDFWKIGDRVVVRCSWDLEATLINVDHLRGIALDSYYFKGTLSL